MAGLVEHGQALQHILGDISTLATRDLVQLFNEHGDGESFPDLLRKTFGEIVRPYAHAPRRSRPAGITNCSPTATFSRRRRLICRTPGLTRR